MRLSAIAWRNLRIRGLSSSLTAFSVALGTGLIAAIWLLLAQVESRYTSSLAGYDAIVGPKQGSSLQLFLSTVLNLDDPAGVLPMSVYRELRDGRLAKRYGVRYAIPQSRGDTFGGFPVIGTTDEMFTKFSRGSDGKAQLVLAEGSAWTFSHEDFLSFANDYARELTAHGGDLHDHDHAGGEEAGHEHLEFPKKEWCKAVIGATVAAKLGLGLGDTFTPVHGQDEPGAHTHEEAKTTIVGVLARTGTPIDRSIFVPIGLQLSLDEHNAIQPPRGTNPASLEFTADMVQISAIVIDARHPLAASNLRYDFQTRPDAQVAWPGQEIAKLLGLVGDAAGILRVVAWLVIVVAAAGVLVALYNTMNERRREIAIMRALGARRGQVFAIVVIEAGIVALFGAVLGVLLAHGAAFAAGPAIQDRVNVPIDPMAFTSDEIWLILAVGAVGVVAGLLPAIKGAATEVASNLGPIS
ncbi:MAG: FtsX-like permease family protein [Planctomycetota bacterium]